MKKTNMESMWNADQQDGTYTNPILYTDYSDPDVIRVGDDYFMVASSFCNVPAVPVLHSLDLVNWKVISYVMDKLPFERYNKPVHGCGTWAPAIRYHNHKFYVFIPFPDEGIMVCSTENPWKQWSKPTFVKEAAGWIDPCPFWDEDGRAYMVNAFAKSRVGFNSVLYISEMKPDCSGVLGEGRMVYDGHETQPTIEGPKMYKRNGWYYIFAPAGGVATGWQTVLRSRDVYGPYEEKIVMHQGNSEINGPHQGGWIETQTGEDWFLHFQDVGNAGRILHLQPMRWENDWPIIGEDKEHTGCGTPVMRYKKPDVGRKTTISSPADSDYFDTESLGLQWQWNANPKDNWYSFSKKGLRLFAQYTPADLCLCDVPNLLLQKWPAPEFQITACVHLKGMEEGDIGGLISFGGNHTALCVMRRENNLILQLRFGERESGFETCTNVCCLSEGTGKVYMRMLVEKERDISFQYSLDGDMYICTGKKTTASPGKWVGVKAGLFCNHIDDENIHGYIDISSFLFAPIDNCVG